MTTALTKLWWLSNFALLLYYPFRINLINNAMCIMVKTNYTSINPSIFSPLLVSDIVYAKLVHSYLYSQNNTFSINNIIADKIAVSILIVYSME